MKAAAAAIEALPSERVATLRAGTSIALRVEGQDVELGPEDVLVQVETRADFELETDGRFVVWFDVELDEELVLEGIAREVVNRLNSLRKESGLAPEDRITLILWATRDDVRAALDRFGAMISAETLATACSVREPASDESGWVDLDLGDGRTLRARLLRSR